MHTIIRYGLLSSTLLLLLSYWNRNNWSESLTLASSIAQEPLQTISNQQPQKIIYNGLEFIVKPRYHYELSGLVVSMRAHQADYKGSLHGINEDYLNVADLCVVWGESADPVILKHFNFSNGQFTCNYQTRNNDAWQAFNPNKLSNNHVLATDQNVRDALTQVNIGDQIKISGYLADYINPKGFERKTSIVRSDTGNGACETIFVNDIETITTMTGPWRTLMWISLTGFVFFLGLYIRQPIQARNKTLKF